MDANRRITIRVLKEKEGILTIESSFQNVEIQVFDAAGLMIQAAKAKKASYTLLDVSHKSMESEIMRSITFRAKRLQQSSIEEVSDRIMSFFNPAFDSFQAALMAEACVAVHNLIDEINKVLPKNTAHIKLFVS